MDRAIAYCRVSDPRQVKDDGSLARQERDARALSLQRGYEVLRVFVERGESAKTDDRTVLKEMLAFVRSTKVDVLIIPKIDRLARVSYDYHGIKLVLSRFGVRIESVGEHIEDTPVGRFMETVLSGTAQLDNEIRAERSKNGQIGAFKQGRWIWQAPYGYEHRNKNIAPKEPEASLMRTIFERSRGLTKAQAYREAKKLGFPLCRSRLYCILESPVYAGKMKAFGIEVTGAFEPLVPEHLIRGIKSQQSHLIENPDFPLKTLGRCCGSLTASWSKGRSGRYGYYRCRTCDRNFPKEKVELQFVAYLDSFQIPERFARNLPSKLRQHLGPALEREQKRVIEAERQLEKNRELQRNLALKNASGVIPDDLAAEQIQSLREAAAKLTEASQAKPITFDLEVERVVQVLKAPGQFWQKASHSTRLRFQNLMFPEGVKVTRNLRFGTKKMRLLEPALQLVGPHSSALEPQADELWNQLIEDLRAFHEQVGEEREPG